MWKLTTHINNESKKKFLRKLGTIRMNENKRQYFKEKAFTLNSSEKKVTSE